MEISLVVHDFTPESAQGRYALELARRLADRCRFRVFANTFTDSPPPGVGLVPVPASRGRRTLAVPTFLLSAQRLLRSHPHALIHAQGLSCWDADLATVHTCNAARLKALPPEDSRARRFARLLVGAERAFFRQQRLRHLITVSCQVTTEVREHYGWRRDVTVIRHGTDLEVFRPPADDLERRRARSAIGVREDAWLWVFAGQADKGLRDALACLPGFPEAELVVMSRSEPGPFRREAQVLGVTHRVHFRGFDPRPEWVFRASDALVFPTRYESSGMVVAEAMASGLPVVVGRNAGIAETLEEGRTGCLVAPGDLEGLRRCLRWLRDHPGDARAMGRLAREAVSRFSWDACADATWKVYEAVWRARPGATRAPRPATPAPAP